VFFKTKETLKKIKNDDGFKKTAKEILILMMMIQKTIIETPCSMMILWKIVIDVELSMTVFFL